MSAYNVSNEHINFILTYASRVNAHIYLGRKRNVQDAEVLQSLAETLREANQVAIETRYGRRDDLEPMVFEPNGLAMHAAPVDVLKQLDCFDYQACEDPEYSSSHACKIINDIRAAAIRRLAGYDSAPWGIDDTAPAPDFAPTMRKLSDLKDGEKPRPGELLRIF